MKTKLTTEQIAENRKKTRNALANLALEGMTVDEEHLKRLERMNTGEISPEEATLELIKKYKRFRKA